MSTVPLIYQLTKTQISSFKRLGTPRLLKFNLLRRSFSQIYDGENDNSKIRKDRKGKKKGEIKPIDSEQQDLINAAENVVQAVKPEAREAVASDLLQKLRDHKQVYADKAQSKNIDFQSMVNMLNTKPSRYRKKSVAVKGLEDSQSDRHRQTTRPFGKRRDFRRSESVIYDKNEPKLFEGNGLGIFSNHVSADTKKALEQDKEVSLFTLLEEEYLEELMTIPHTNAFEEEIYLTKRGKMWKFPINNEEGMEEEAQVGFNEHIFLDQLLTDIPERGPVRHFMELVTVGLSKNPFLTVGEKRAHIQWFKSYFQDKEHLFLDSTIEEAEQAIS